MEQFYEQTVVNNNIDECKKKTKTLIIAKTVCTIVALALLLTIIPFIGSKSFLYWFLILTAASVPFICAAIIIGHINKRNNTEYDYTIDDENLKITEVYFRERRKLKHTIRLRTVESVGVFGSEGYKKIQDKAEKKYLAIVNYDDEDTIMYLLYSTDKGRRIIFVEPDKGFMIALRRVVSAVNVFDKSVSDLNKKLNGDADI